VLALSQVSVAYGGAEVVSRVSFEVRPRELVGLVGPNGAGKSSLLKAVVGLVPPAAGSITFDGDDITRSSVEAIGRRGVRLVPEGRRILASLTVAENLRLGATGCPDRRNVMGAVAAMCERFPILGERAGMAAGQLSGGEQQMLAIARALMAQPRLLVLDEPTLGLAPLIVDRVFDILAELREEGVTMLLVEQNAFRTIELADYTLLMNNGRVALEGRREDLLQRADVVHSYLGV
jgi:branched-chain amino acid transport system ATP-binding protein